MQLRRRLRESDLKKKQLKLNVLGFKKRHALQLKLQKLRESDLKKKQLKLNVLGLKKRQLQLNPKDLGSKRKLELQPRRRLRESDLKKRLQLQLRPNVLGLKKRRLRDKVLRKNED